MDGEDVVIDPWGSAQSTDYSRIIDHTTDWWIHIWMAKMLS